MSTVSKVPTERLVLEWPSGVAETEESRDAFDADAYKKMLDFANELRARGERAWFEVWHKGFPGRKDTTARNFDAVEVSEDGIVTTLPPYSELQGVTS